MRNIIISVLIAAAVTTGLTFVIDDALAFDIVVGLAAGLAAFFILTKKVMKEVEALNFKGGPEFEDKLQILLRAATASWLNAAVEISFPLRRYADIQPMVNAAIASGDAYQVTQLAEYLDGLNNQECPLDADESQKNDV